MKLLQRLLLAFVLLFTGCAKGTWSPKDQGTSGSGNTGNTVSHGDPVSITGDYYAISCNDGNGTELELDGEVLHLYADGTGTFDYGDQSWGLQWNYSNSVFTFTDEEGDTFDGHYYDGMISGEYFNGYNYLFTNDRELYQNLMSAESSGTFSEGNTGTSSLSANYGNRPYNCYTLATLYEQQYGLKTAYTAVPYGWSAYVTVEWGMISTMYPACATVTMISPDGQARFEIRSPWAFMQMARNGNWVPEGTYLDLYNTYLNYRNAGAYNEYILGLLGYQATVLARKTPNTQEQQALDQAAYSYLQSFGASGTNLVNCEGTSEKTSFFITQGNAYEVEIMSADLMAETTGGMYHSITWMVPYTAVFTAYTEEAYSAYFSIFEDVAANTTFSEEFIYIVMRNAQYINQMMSQYLLEKAYNPSSSDISSWDRDYVDSGSDDFANQWSDVIKEQNEYITEDGHSIKVSTQYDTVYQNDDLIYMGPQADAPDNWTQLYAR